MRSTAPYPPGHPLRARLRRGRQPLLSYRTEPVRPRLAEQPAQELKGFATAQFR